MKWGYLPSLLPIYVVMKTNWFLDVKGIFFSVCIITEIYPSTALFVGFPCEEMGFPLPNFEPQIQENSDSGRYLMSRESDRLFWICFFHCMFLWKVPGCDMHSHQICWLKGIFAGELEGPWWFDVSAPLGLVLMLKSWERACAPGYPGQSFSPRSDCLDWISFGSSITN